ncbi:ATP-binding protein [Streptomyces lavendulocolor]|uniref:ATP-binding protein n=1 Tax=Streptomyces lavendulocolor TaxID=67316 RepID=UPI003C2BB0E9
MGRDVSLGALRARLERTKGSHGGLVLVTGEAGIGKTSLVRHAAHEARGLGMLVAHGTCWDSDSTPGYWPWTQALRRLRAGVTGEEWARTAGTAGGALPVLLGEVAGSQDLDRFQLFDAVTTLLTGASQSRPVMVVLEDLHWADPASLGLLEFTAQHTWFERLLVVGTFRDVEVQRPDHPLRGLLEPLSAKATTVRLTGLAPPEVAELMARTAGRRPDAALAEEVCARTGGNPFFVEETARLWSAGHVVTAVAPGVRAALRRRLALLGAPAVELLDLASVLGRRFTRGTLAAMAGLAGDRAGDLLGEAARAGLVEPRGGDGYVFTHDLVRESLYEALDAPRLRRAHASAVRALSASGDVADQVRPTELARHAYFAGEELPCGEAVDLLVAAARHAAGRLAGEEAVSHYRRALERLEAAPSPRRLLLTLDLALELQLVGEHERAWAAFEDATAQARALADPALLGRVALTAYGADGRGDGTGLKARVLREAYRSFVPGDGPVTGPGAPGAVRAVARHVVAAARSAGDDDALHIGLWAGLHAVWEPGTAADRVVLAGELMEVSRRREDMWMELLAASMRWVALLELDDPAFLEQFQAMVAAVRTCGLPRTEMISVIDRSVVHGFTGRFAEAAELVARTLASTGPYANYYQYFVRHHGWSLALLQGRFAEMDGIHRALRECGHPFAELLEAITALERGEPPRGPVPRPRGSLDGDGVLERSITPLWLRYRAQAAALSRDPARCEEARAALEPYRGQWMVSLYGWDVSGPAALWAGVLDAARGHWDAAIGEFTRARRSADRLGARPWSVRARCELAGALLARAGNGDAETARELLREVAAEAEELGMPHLAARAEGAVPAPEAAVDAYEFSRTEAVWRLTYEGRTVHLPDSKGLGDLHFLLRHPGQDVPAVRLLAPGSEALAVAAGALGGDPVLDDEAKARYRRRLDRLDEEIDRAVVLGDDERAAAYDREREALLAELRSAVGLAGRSRRLGDETERARKNVTARIRDALRRIDAHHPELAAHLRSAVSTGGSCRYAPERRVAWRL